jgi:hypothetical protein
MKHADPRTVDCSQVLDEEELIALDEFAKLEKRLEAKSKDKKDE